MLNGVPCYWCFSVLTKKVPKLSCLKHIQVKGIVRHQEEVRILLSLTLKYTARTHRLCVEHLNIEVESTPVL